jgi:hypothetical protein
MMRSLATRPGSTRPPARSGSSGLATAVGASRPRRGRLRVAGPSPARPGQVTLRAAARTCWVSPQMIRWWIETGAWPLPYAVCGTTLYFKSADVDGWLATGEWPDEAHFRER